MGNDLRLLSFLSECSSLLVGTWTPRLRRNSSSTRSASRTEGFVEVSEDCDSFPSRLWEMRRGGFGGGSCEFRALKLT